MTRSEFETLLANVARLVLVFIGAVLLVSTLDRAQVILAPIFLAVVIGLMFGPLSDKVEQAGIPSWISAAAMVLLFIGLIAAAAAGFAVPLSDWLDKLPQIWTRLQSELTDWKGVIASVGGLQEQLRSVMGTGASMKVEVQDTTTVESVVYLAPTFLAQIILFLASLYFFIATRKGIRDTAITYCITPRLRNSVRRTFDDVETRVSRYLMSITLVNVILAIAVSIALYLLDVPSALLWGLMAGVLNYVIYIGPAVMALILTGVGLATADTSLAILTPPLVYLALNLIEAQFLTPAVLGRTMTLNPFLVLIAIAGWIWIWGPAGGFVAVPSLLILGTILANILPHEG